ncbi:hypothetical protein GCM10011414_26070 [Croceivirga lutea]|uniref:glycosyltransferase n=1 Tax=Croceivirga lutea TaxID=1775167 RepID=UPI00163A0FAD|nr:glycosyltransferase [Croceivirga lutea]GGG54988.1 hypothetical protein GCM10011414_26070 [Croceivirga lutea]
MNKGLLYISNIDESHNIYHSQVKQLLFEYKKNFRVLEMILSNKDSGLINGRIYFKLLPGSYNNLISWYNLKNRKDELVKLIEDFDVDYIIGRSTNGALMGLHLLSSLKTSPKFIVDIRADVLDETWLRKKYFGYLSHYFSLKKIFKKVDYAFVVSSYLKNKINKTYRLSSDRIGVFGTIVSDDLFYFNNQIRNHYRTKFNFSQSDIIVVYTGNLAPWQNLETILTAYKNTKNGNVKLVVLTKQQTELRKLITELEIEKDVMSFSVPYEEVSNYLQMADYGILIRDAIPTNLASSPTKFGEYINSGLNVIINKIETDYYNVSIEKNLPVTVVDKKENLVNLFDELKLIQNKASKKIQLAKDTAYQHFEFLSLKKSNDTDRL